MRIQDYCTSFGAPRSMRIFNWETWQETSLNAPEIISIPLSWDASQTIFRGYKAEKIFDHPDDTKERYKLRLFLNDDAERWISISESPSLDTISFVFAFQTLPPFADKNGEHFGIHPCRAFSVPRQTIKDFFAAVAAYQQRGAAAFPAIIASNDPRWKRGTLKPTTDFVNMRSLPTTQNNLPIRKIEKPILVWYAKDEAWGAWMQVKLGSTLGWVSTEFGAIT